jgi:Ca-activated chloride channel family protein
MNRLALLLILAVSGSAVSGGQTRFVSKVERVRVDVLASANGRPVTDLTADDFEVKDNGVVQKVTLVAGETSPVHVMLALDTSASLSMARLDRLRDACRALIGKLQPGEAAGLITFSHVVTQLQPLTGELDRITGALATVVPSGDTALVDATSLGLTLTDHSAGRGLLVVFSDGVDTASWQAEDAVLRSARGFEAVAYAVSVTSPGASPKFLRNITSATGGKVLEVQSNERLESAFVQILEEFRQRYLLSYSPAGVSKPGWHKIDVRVKRRGVSVRARPGYFAR